MNNTRALFDNILSGGYSELCRMKDAAEIETEIIDFKQLSKQRPPLQPDDIKNLAKALSGFGNGAGGIVIWGIDCRKDSASRGADTIKEFCPIVGLRQVQSELYDRASSLVMPMPVGVVHECILQPGEIDSGFVITYIPEHVGPAVQVVQDKDYRFYFRTGSKFERMPQWMIADRFLRNSSCELVLQWRSAGFRNTDGRYEIHLDLKNNGKRTARNITLVLWVGAKNDGISSTTYHYFTGGSMGNDPPPRHVFSGHERTVVHPTMSVMVCTLDVSPQMFAEGFILKHSVYCDDFSVDFAELRIGSKI
jgi:hypothetical protein